MLELHASRPARNLDQLKTRLAEHPDDILAAQKLRYRVFADEMGARLNTRHPGIDQDFFDSYCEHLLVHDEHSGEVVGTYRILPPHQARKVGSYYSETEFDLTRLQHLRHQMVELGRSCVHPDYRSGATIAMLWSGLAEYMHRNRFEYLIGCVSVSLRDGGQLATALRHHMLDKAHAPIEWRVFPRHPLSLLPGRQDLASLDVPPLVKGYLRAGAMVCGEPAWDPDFNTADFLMILPMSRLNPRYARHFLRS
ncbi:GNAT family N-acetyltransferase [Chitinilyticum piscinae]|uniref:L-ornithine N(alpha)-acyltransferase n=1 Tax=Chitinilyticum piscinae TaxID=2866724 RepID=A0A8J7FJB9_9NEIS|nr:GNAT family N-acyltransferase [Chitinilyticum piscinae]MBE9608912.1 GNAT family N-acetyltransferase [Chitinilyticum piscinae]